MNPPNREDLANALRAAAAAHHDYETNALAGERDARWSGWYAGYVLGRLGDFAPASVLAGWLAEAPGSDDWAASAAEAVVERSR